MTPAFAGERHRSTRHKPQAPRVKRPHMAHPRLDMVIRTCWRTACLSGSLPCRTVADPANIDNALEYNDCNQALDSHLVRCRPMECPIVETWVNAPHQEREAAMAALADAGPPHHGLSVCDRHSAPVPDQGGNSLGPVV